MARILICALVVALGYYANGQFSMDDICNKHKDHGRCENQRIKTMCSKQCGGGEEQTPPPNEETTTRRTVTNRPAPPPASNGGGGGGGGGGGNKKCDKRSPCVSYEEANKAFRARCESSPEPLKETCYDHCRYDQEGAVLKKAFLSGPCPLSQLRPFLTAAAGGKDNTACCEDQGVTAQKKTGVCGCFCNPTGPVWPQKHETAKYAPCISVLTGIMECHYYAEGAA